MTVQNHELDDIRELLTDITNSRYRWKLVVKEKSSFFSSAETKIVIHFYGTMRVDNRLAFKLTYVPKELEEPKTSWNGNFWSINSLYPSTVSVKPGHMNIMAGARSSGKSSLFKSYYSKILDQKTINNAFFDFESEFIEEVFKEFSDKIADGSVYVEPRVTPRFDRAGNQRASNYFNRHVGPKRPTRPISKRLATKQVSPGKDEVC